MIYTDGTHLMTDSDNINELHKFAKQIGLKHSWFQYKNLKHLHYDIRSARILDLAMAYGAYLVTPRELVKVCVLWKSR